MAMQEQLMLIVPRFDYALHAWLEKKFEGDPEVLVMRDRRAGQRRQRRAMRNQDRRRCDRRGEGRARAGVWLPIKTAAAHEAPAAAPLSAT